MHQTDKDFGKSVITVKTEITLPAAPGALNSCPEYCSGILCSILGCVSN